MTQGSAGVAGPRPVVGGGASHSRLATMLLVVAVLGWSGNFVVGRLVHGQIPPIALAFARWVGAFVVITPFAWKHLRRDMPALKAARGTVLALSFTGITCFNSLVYVGLQTTTAVNGLLQQSIIPVLIAVIAFLLYRDRPRASELVGLPISLLGVWTVVTRGNILASGGLRLAHGDGFVFAAVVAYAVYTVLLRHRPVVHPLSLLSATFGLGAAMLSPVFVAESASGQRIPLTVEALAAVGYVTVVPSIISYFCWNAGVQLVGGLRAGQYIHLMPVLGAVMAYVVLGERLHTYHLVAAALIASGIVISSGLLARFRRTRPAQPAGR